MQRSKNTKSSRRTARGRRRASKVTTDRKQPVRMIRPTMGPLFSQAPVAMNLNVDTSFNVRYLSESAVTIEGCQPFGYLATSVISDGCITLFEDNVVYQALPLNPSWMFPSASVPAGIAFNYSRFRFRRAEIIYKGGCPTSTNGNFLLGFYSDGIGYGVSPTPLQISELPGASFTPPWDTRMVSQLQNSRNEDNNLYYIDYNTGGSSDSQKRQEYQGVFWNYTAFDFSSLGYFYIRYVCDLYDPRPEIDLALLEAKRMKHGVRRHLRSVPVPQPVSLCDVERKESVDDYEDVSILPPPPVLLRSSRLTVSDPGPIGLIPGDKGKIKKKSDL
jgi:hypothetical protein